MNTAADTLQCNDSLKRAMEQLFIEGAQFGPFEITNTLTTTPPATAADLFGQGSTVTIADTAAATLLPLASNSLFQCLVLILTGVYILIVYQHAGNIAALFSHTTGGTEMRNSNNNSQFLNITALTGLLAAGVLCVKFIDLQFPDNMLPRSAAAGISLIATTALIVLGSIQTGMLYLIGQITLMQDFMAELTHIKRTTLSLTTITIAPILLLYTLCPTNTQQVWTYIILGETIVILLFFLVKSLRLFVSKKISILHWFLYLCIVEIFPVSLLWLLAVR